MLGVLFIYISDHEFIAHLLAIALLWIRAFLNRIANKNVLWISIKVSLALQYVNK